MNIILVFIVLLCGVLMFVVKRPQKLAFFLISSMCFSMVIVPFPYFTKAYEYLSLCFLFSEIGYMWCHIYNLKKSILFKLLIAMCIATIVLFYSSPHYKSLGDGLVLFKAELLIKYLVVAYSFICLKYEKDIRVVYRLSLVGLSMLTLFAIVNYLNGKSDFVDMMLSGRDVSAGDVGSFDVGEKYSSTDRFRVQGMFILAFDYGYVCAIFLLFYIFGIYKKYISRVLGMFAILCCSFGVITCNCRTVLFSIFFAMIAYFFICYGKKIVKYLLFLVFLAGIIYLSSDSVSESVNSKVLSIFSEDGAVQGSSLSMRAIQYVAVISHVEGHYMIGRGKDYFLIDLGWGDGRDKVLDPELQGLEGVLLNLILERGLVGIAFWCLFYFGLFFYFYKKRKTFPEFSALGIASLTLYLLYSNMTGEMGCVYPTMLILGIALNGIVILQNNKDTMLKEQPLICYTKVED